MNSAVRLLKAEKIPVFRRGEEEYERFVATPNLLFRFSRPECVIQPANASHVQAIIKQAKSQNLKITIKCGGALVRGTFDRLPGHLA